METIASPGLLYTLAVFVAVIGALVFVHEFGHYGVARLFGIRVETFSVGFGPELISRVDRNGTRWRLALIPLGGYAKFAGDANGASQPDPSALASIPQKDRGDLFHFRPLYQRAAVVAAGPAINFLFAILVFAGFFMTYGHQITPPVVSQVVPDSPAAAVGIQPGDRFLSMDGKRVERFEDLMRIVTLNPGTEMQVEVQRGEQELTLAVTPRIVLSRDRFGNEFHHGALGVASGALQVVREGPLGALRWAVIETFDTCRMMWETIVQVVTGRRDVAELGGPVKIAQFSGQSAALGLPALISFVALISINLGFINLLPIPMLDGGHLFLYALEAIRRRPLDPKLQEWAFMSGFALLMSLMLFLTWNDLQSVGLWGKLASVVS